MQKISAIAVNYRTSSLVERFLDNLTKVKKDMEIVFVNNSPEDGSSELIKNKFPAVKVIELENPGLSAAYNQGAKHVDTEYILFLGTDAFPTADTLDGMVDYLDQHSDVGIVTTALVLESGEQDLDSHRGFPTMLSSFFKFSGFSKLFPKSKFFNYYNLGHLINDKNPHEIDATISHFLLVRRSVFQAISGFDAGFFLYGEDIDFCYRVKESGYKVMYLPQFKTLHLKGASIGIRKHNKEALKMPYKHRRLQVLRSTDAMRNFMKKHYSKKYGFIQRGIMFIGITLLEKMRLFIEWLS